MQHSTLLSFFFFFFFFSAICFSSPPIKFRLKTALRAVQKCFQGEEERSRKQKALELLFSLSSFLPVSPTWSSDGSENAVNNQRRMQKRSREYISCSVFVFFPFFLKFCDLPFLLLHLLSSPSRTLFSPLSRLIDVFSFKQTYGRAIVGMCFGFSDAKMNSRDTANYLRIERKEITRESDKKKRRTQRETDAYLTRGSNHTMLCYHKSLHIPYVIDTFDFSL